ncbi:MAG: 1,3-beta-glucanase, partial [Alphaproteobacteria bacterium]|nr:1,3-beta-glucanase [Alphaproteobacteria bacterium]
GNDIIRGGKGDDVIDGGDGDDWISGDRGDDTLTGGRGADTFHSSAGAGLDLVTDFNAGEGDRIELDNGTPFTVSQEGADTVIHMQGTRLVLKNVKAASLPRGAIYYK